MLPLVSGHTNFKVTEDDTHDGEDHSIPITKVSKVSTQIFDLVRWFGPSVLLTGGP